MKTIAVCFELNFFNINVKGNIYGQVHSEKYCRVLPERVFHWQFLITHIFFVSLRFGANYIMGEFKVKNAIFVYTYFFGIFLLFFIKKDIFYHFQFFFLWSIKFSQQNIN